MSPTPFGIFFFWLGLVLKVVQNVCQQQNFMAFNFVISVNSFCLGECMCVCEFVSKNVSRLKAAAPSLMSFDAIRLIHSLTDAIILMIISQMFTYLQFN